MICLNKISFFKMRCYLCNKKTLLIFDCKCDGKFCNKHRLPEVHNCTYDFKTDKEKLKINNPKIINNKFDKVLK